MRLSDSEIAAFLDERHTVIVATLRADGTAHLAAVWYRWDGTAFWIATNRTTAKYRNLLRDSRVSLIVDDPPREKSIAAYGEAEVMAVGEAAWDGALAVVRRYVDDRSPTFVIDATNLGRSSASRPRRSYRGNHSHLIR